MNSYDSLPYGPHWNPEKKMPQCLIGGNMCDICFQDSQKPVRADLDAYVCDLLVRLGIQPKPKPQIEVFPEIKNIEGINSVYELTLTTTKDDPAELRQYLDKIVASKMFGVTAYKACYELQKNGKPHIHAMLWSTKKVLNSNHIKSKIKFPYIFTLKFVRMQPNFYNYILKNEKDISTIEYCLKNNLTQIWHKPDEPVLSESEGPNTPQGPLEPLSESK